MKERPRFVIFAHNATYDKLHQVATLGLTAAAMGKDVIIVLLFWTIKKLAEGKIDEMDFPPEYVSAAGDVARLLKERKVPTISEMFEEAKFVGKFQLIACSAGLEYHGCRGASGDYARGCRHGATGDSEIDRRCGNHIVYLIQPNSRGKRERGAWSFFSTENLKRFRHRFFWIFFVSNS